MKLLLAAVFLYLPLHASADPDIFDGTWKGKGTYILKGDMTECSEFELTFSTYNDIFTFESGHRVCEKHSETFYKVPMRFKDGILYFNGLKVGSYDGNRLEAHYRMPDGNSFRNWRMSMRREGQNMVYEESRTMEGETEPLISFAGLVIKQ